MISSDSGAATSGADQDTPTTARLWQEYVNSHGGINGHPVDVIVEDDKDNPATALQDLQDLVQNQHVVAIGDDSYVDSTWAKAAEADNVPVIGVGGSGTNPEYETNTNMFATSNNLTAGLWGPVKVASLIGGITKLGALYCAEVATCAQLVPALKQLGPPLNISIVYGAGMSASAPNYESQCVAAKASGAQAVYIASPSPTAQLRVFDNCASLGFHPIWITAGPGVSAKLATDTNIQQAWAYVGNIPWFVRNDATKTFHQVMDSYLPNAVSQPEVIGDWVGLQTFLTAAQHVSSTPTPQDIYQGLYAINNNTIGGLTAPLTFTQGKPHPDPCIFVLKVQGGTFSTPAGTSAFCTTP